MPANEFRFLASSTAPALARATVSTVISAWSNGGADDVVLLTSELVTNAVRHTSSAALGDVIVRVDVGTDRIHVEVLNPGASFDPPAPQTPSTTGTGLGLFLVDSLATSWGVEIEGARTKVWFEVPASADEHERSSAAASPTGSD